MISEERFNQIIQTYPQLHPLLVIGDIGIDKYTYGTVKRISPEAPVPVLEVVKEWYKLGLAANVSDNLRSLGVNSTLCGIIGNDRNGELLESLLEENKLKTWGIVRAHDRKTTLKERVTTKIQQICRIDYETQRGVNSEDIKKLRDRSKDFLNDHSCLIIEDYAKGLITEEFSAFLIKLFIDAGKMVLVDPSRNSSPFLYRGATLLKPNATESEILVDSLGYKERNLEKMAQILIDKLELKMLVITLGGQGMALMEREGEGKLKIIPTVATEVFDVSGAGDTAISAIGASLMAGANLEEAAWIGNCASGVVVGKKGTATVSIEELKKFYKNRLSELVSVTE